MPVKIIKTISEKGYMNDKFYRTKTAKKKTGGLATKNYVKKAVKLQNELKELRTSSTRTAYNTLTDTVWEQNSLSLIGQGDSNSSRDGDKVSLSYIKCATNILTGYGGVVDTTGLDPFQVRIILYQCKRGFTPAQVLATLPTNGALAPLGFITLRKADILYDRVYNHKEFIVIGQQNAGTSTDSKVYATNYLLPVRISRKPAITTLEWNPASTGTVDPDVAGAVMLAYCQFVNVGAGSDVTISVLTTPDSRITFRDK